MYRYKENSRRLRADLHLVGQTVVLRPDGQFELESVTADLTDEQRVLLRQPALTLNDAAAALLELARLGTRTGHIH